MIGDGVPRVDGEPTIKVEVDLEYNPTDHVYSEGLEDLDTSYSLPE
jgi:hypothetical protein